MACRLVKAQVTEVVGVVCPQCKEQRKHGRLIYKCEGCRVHRCPTCFETSPDGRCFMDQGRSRVVWSPAPKPMIRTGRDALKAVGLNDGCWNWALVGPDPEGLPLAGGGPGSIDEMRGCLAKQEAESGNSNFYGLLRLTFGTGRCTRRKFVFIRVSRVDDAGLEAKVAARYGKAAAQRSLMEKALQEFARFTVTFEAMGIADLTLENVLERVRKASTADADLLTQEAFDEAMCDFRKVHGQCDSEARIEAAAAEVFPEERPPAEAESQLACAESEPMSTEFIEEELAEVKACEAPQEEMYTEPEPPEMMQFQSEVEVVPEATPPPAVPPPAPCGEAEAGSNRGASEQKVADDVQHRYEKGDYVMVFSQTAGEWMDDGVVVIALSEDGKHDKLELTAGSLKVQYNNRKTFKWLLGHQVKDYIRPSRRPLQPSTLTGELVKETHSLITSWHLRYFELSRGSLKWWKCKADAQVGVLPNGRLNLFGLELHLEDNIIYCRTPAAKGVTYAFDATSEFGAVKWVEALQKHEAYCRQMATYHLQQKVQQAANKRLDELEAFLEARTPTV